MDITPTRRSADSIFIHGLLQRIEELECAKAELEEQCRGLVRAQVRAGGNTNPTRSVAQNESKPDLDSLGAGKNTNEDTDSKKGKTDLAFFWRG